MMMCLETLGESEKKASLKIRVSEVFNQGTRMGVPPSVLYMFLLCGKLGLKNAVFRPMMGYSQTYCSTELE